MEWTPKEPMPISARHFPDVAPPRSHDNTQLYENWRWQSRTLYGFEISTYTTNPVAKIDFINQLKTIIIIISYNDYNQFPRSVTPRVLVLFEIRYNIKDIV